ncbi:hypothetical protein PAXRUDRAFT_544615 [Paxillus rubicundulus Ve08.2h10]|uniref:Uncharacterized protein n=1 Tax=Paxillus rubicundulus Ve08.2h10 TaxID=930991 RepID=A0A0D0BSS9_9AGAM|nr:hypothetical protein PAXRUDRAFT_544615 [Paxillus rubicundulus Ve08.2h10]
MSCNQADDRPAVPHFSTLIWHRTDSIPHPFASSLYCTTPPFSFLTIACFKMSPGEYISCCLTSLHNNSLV